MANSPKSLKQLGLTRGRMVLIGVLAIVLVGVVYLQYGGSTGDETFGIAEPTGASAAASVVLQSTTTKTVASNADVDGNAQAALLEFDQAKWKPPKLSVVIAYDPFALPSGFPQPPKAVGDSGAVSAAVDTLTAAEEAKQLADALEESQSQLDELKQRGVHVITGQNDRYVAMIGDRMIHVGDDINGFTVTKIDPTDGVRIERKNPE